MTVRSADEEPKKLPNGDPDIEEPDAKGNISWVTDKDMVARSRLTHEQIAELKEVYGDSEGGA